MQPALSGGGKNSGMKEKPKKPLKGNIIAKC
jgi:hypothetical protein